MKREIVEFVINDILRKVSQWSVMGLDMLEEATFIPISINIHFQSYLTGTETAHSKKCRFIKYINVLSYHGNYSIH